MTATPTSLRLESCYFGTGAAGQWPRLARVLAYTAAQHCPGWERTIAAITPPPMRRVFGVGSSTENVQKTAHWCDRAEAAPDGCRLLLIDTDTIILRPLDPIWDQPFDLAYTVRPAAAALPLNAGVVFLRVSDPVRAFLRQWRDETIRMLDDRAHHLEWRRRYGGIAQAAFGALLATRPALALLPIPCAEWNCEDSTWATFDPARVRILHLKSRLRLAVFSLGQNPPALQPLTTLWKTLEREASRVEVSA